MIGMIFSSVIPAIREAMVEVQTLDLIKQFAVDTIDQCLIAIDKLQHDVCVCTNINRILVKTVQQIYEKDCDIKDIVARSQYQILTEQIVDLVSFCDNCELDIFVHDRNFARRKGYVAVVGVVKQKLTELKQMYNEIHL